VATGGETVVLRQFKHRSCRTGVGSGSGSDVRFLDLKKLSPIDVALRCIHTGQHGPACPFAIILMLEGNRNTATIPPKKSQVYLLRMKKFCGATPLVKAAREALST
jgi:hypothetical protein